MGISHWVVQDTLLHCFRPCFTNHHNSKRHWTWFCIGCCFFLKVVIQYDTGCLSCSFTDEGDDAMFLYNSTTLLQLPLVRRTYVFLFNNTPQSEVQFGVLQWLTLRWDFNLVLNILGSATIAMAGNVNQLFNFDLFEKHIMKDNKPLNVQIFIEDTTMLLFHPIW